MRASKEIEMVLPRTWTMGKPQTCVSQNTKQSLGDAFGTSQFEWPFVLIGKKFTPPLRWYLWFPGID
jgi:hypothetical protein